MKKVMQWLNADSGMANGGIVLVIIIFVTWGMILGNYLDDDYNDYHSNGIIDGALYIGNSVKASWTMTDVQMDSVWAANWHKAWNRYYSDSAIAVLRCE